MKDMFLDVRLELNEASLVEEAEPTAFIVETARAEADRKCQETGAKLRTDAPPEFYIERGEHRLTGERCLLVATRWKVVAPESTQPER